MKRLLIVVAVVLAACTGSAGDDTTTSATTPTQGQTTAPADNVETTEPELDTATTAASVDAGLGSRGNPIPSGDPAVVGDYEIKVIGFTPDATAEVLDYNEFNDPPPEGSVYTLIRLEYAYFGDTSGDPWIDVSWSAVGDSNVSSDGGDCVTYPDNVFDLGELFPGGTTDGNICLTVVEGDVGSLLLIVEDYFSFDETRVFFDLQAP